MTVSKTAPLVFVLALACCCFGIHAQEAQAPLAGQAPDAEAVTAGMPVRSAGYGHSTEGRENHPLDPAVFTGISPFTVDETAVKLPPDQQIPQ